MPAPPTIFPVKWRSSVDGSLRSTNPLGDYGPLPATLTVDLAAFSVALGPLLGELTGRAALSLNLRGTWLTGTEKTTAVLGIRTISGDNAVSKNWSVAGSTFAQSFVTGSIGAGVLEIYGVDSTGKECTFGLYSWSIAAPTGGIDSLAPTVPTGLQVIGDLGQLDCSIDAGADNWDNATAPSGLDHYEVELDGVFNKNVPAVNNPSIQFTATSIGASAPAASASQSAGVWTLNAAGVGIHKLASEECLFVGAPITGDCTLIVKLDSFSSAQQFSTSGIMVRETRDQGAIFGAIYVQPSSPGNGIQVKSRIATGGLGGNVASVNGITACWARLKRSGSTVTAGYSTDGNTFSDIATMSLPMAAQAEWGWFLSSQNPGVSCTSTIREVNLNTNPRVAFTVSTTGSHQVSVRGVDAHGNPSNWNNSVFGTGAVSNPNPTGQFGPIKDNVSGFWITLDPNSGIASNLAYIDAQGNLPGLAGYQIFPKYAAMENPNTPGDYSGTWDSSGGSGFVMMDSIINRAWKYGKYTRVNVADSAYAAPQKSFPKGIIPLYQSGPAYGPPLVGDPVNDAGDNGGNGFRQGSAWFSNNANFSGNFCVQHCWWSNPNVTARIVDRDQKYGARYNGHPGLASWASTGESSILGVTGYNSEAAFPAFQTIYKNARLSFPNCEIRWNANWIGGSDDFCAEWIQFCADWLITPGGPDSAPLSGTKSRNLQATYVFLGYSGSVNGILKYPVRVGQMEYCEEAQFASVSNGSGFTDAKFGLGTPTSLVDNANAHGSRCLIVMQNNWAGHNIDRTESTSGEALHPNMKDFIITNGSGVVTGGAAVNAITRKAQPTLWAAAA